MAALSAYQQMRRANLNENTQFLKNYGLQAPVVESTSVTREEVDEPKPKRVTKRAKKPKRLQQPIPPEERRSSFRIRLKVQQDSFEDYESLKDSDEDDDDDDDDDEEKEKELLKNLSQPNRKLARPPRPNSYGSITGVKVGTWWETRLDCNYDYIHRPTVAGIHQGPDGAYSVALSGGYEDDVDLGHFFTYTGEGGRDLKGTVNNPKNLRTAPQSKDQTLTRGNLALSRNVETGNPVRVIRGYKLRSKFAPERGYRYDGLYNVVRYWEAVGKAGYKIYKYEFKRCDPEPAPWDKSASPVKGLSQDEDEDETEEENENCTLDDEKTSPSEDWHGWTGEPILPKTTSFTLKLGDEEEQVDLIGDKWCRVTDMVPVPTEGALNRQQAEGPAQTTALCEGFNVDSSLSGEGGEWREGQFDVENIVTEAEPSVDDWHGWPDVGFSILDCPQSFNCILQEDI